MKWNSELLQEIFSVVMGGALQFGMSVKDIKDVVGFLYENEYIWEMFSRLEGELGGLNNYIAMITTNNQINEAAQKITESLINKEKEVLEKRFRPYEVFDRSEWKHKIYNMLQEKKIDVTDIEDE